MADHLLAMLVEVSSVTAAGRQLRKPVEVPRPKEVRPAEYTPSERDAAFKRGINVLASTAKGVRS